MVYLRIYGKKHGSTEENLLFTSLPEGNMEKAKRTAAAHNFTISKVIEIASYANGYRDQDVTEKYIDGGRLDK